MDLTLQQDLKANECILDIQDTSSSFFLLSKSTALFYIDIPAMLHPFVLILQPVLCLLSCNLDCVLRLPASLLYFPCFVH